MLNANMTFRLAPVYNSSISSPLGGTATTLCMGKNNRRNNALRCFSLSGRIFTHFIAVF